MLDTVLVVGAGNGGKATAADLALQGKKVRLFEFPEFGGYLDAVRETKTLVCQGDVRGEARIEMVTTNLADAMQGVDAVFICTVNLVHERAARELAPHIEPRHVIVLNPGSTGGALLMAKIWREMGVKELPLLVELGTLTYGCRAKGTEVNVSLKVHDVSYGFFPAARNDGPVSTQAVADELERLFPGLVRADNALAAGLANANPVIHPAITCLNIGRMEKQGSAMLFYGDGVSPMVARMIEAVDKERMALLQALGYPAVSDAEHSVKQGYADSAASYYECYGKGKGFGTFASPDGNMAEHRYFHEDIGQGLVFFMSLGQQLGVPTPASEVLVRLGSILLDIDFIAEKRKTVDSLGLEGLNAEQINAFLNTGARPA
jgi:opine dehydrogenase